VADPAHRHHSRLPRPDERADRPSRGRPRCPGRDGGPAEAFLRSTLRTTTNPTVLQAGYKHNVIPERAEALIDV
jgi:hypothetical protein